MIYNLLSKALESALELGIKSPTVPYALKMKENQTQGKFRPAVTRICLSRQFPRMRSRRLEIQIWVEIQTRDTGK